MKYFIPVGIALIVFGLTFQIWGFSLYYSVFQTSINIIMISLLYSGWFFMLATWGKIVSLFVCGECNLSFWTEPALRKHYGIKHTKNDSGQKKD